MKPFDSKTINGEVFRQMIISGSNNLFNSYPDVDALNVFPVPDGDTGTNMNLTMTSGAKEIMNVRNESIYEVAKSFSRGLLMGARGNSGVILSQIFRGFAQGLEGKPIIDLDDFAAAWVAGTEVAYKAVMKPVEGTILTVIRESSTALKDNITNFNSFGQAMVYLIEEAKKSLQHTPELLPVLKEVGVVDSGGAGLLKIFEGFLEGLHGKTVERKQISLEPTKPQPYQGTGFAATALENEEFGYCTEFIMRLGGEGKKVFDQNRFSTVLESLGNSLVVVQDEDVVKVHVHTLRPGVVLNYGQIYGDFVTLKIENMQEQHSNLVAQEVTGFHRHETNGAVTPASKETKEYALIVASAGEGLKNMFENLRVDYVVTGGQTMNPSTEDFVAAIRHVNARNIFILPNNKNIIMAAEQACGVVPDVNCIVIPSKSIPQGLTACMMFNPDADVEANEQEMREAITRVKTGQVTFAIKDTKIDGMNIKKDEYMGINDKTIICSEKVCDHAAKKLLDHLIDEDAAIVTIIYGDKVAEKEAKQLADYVAEKYMIEVELHQGGQPVYSYIFGVE